LRFLLRGLGKTFKKSKTFIAKKFQKLSSISGRPLWKNFLEKISKGRPRLKFLSSRFFGKATLHLV
jgi:hypothetical protein